MRHQHLDHIRAHATVTEATSLLSRDARLRRWADLLERVGSRPLPALQWVEFHAEPERRRLRRQGSPLAVAFADPVLRASGLANDTLGEAQRFFGLSDSEAHELVCDCHYLGRMTGRSAGKRVRALAGTPVRRGEGVFGRIARAFG